MRPDLGWVAAAVLIGLILAVSPSEPLFGPETALQIIAAELMRKAWDFVGYPVRSTATGSQYSVNDGTVGGLVLRINADGSMSWSLRYRIGKAQRRIMLGTFPTMTVADARKAAGKAMGKVHNQIDPAAQRDAIRTADTVGTLAKLFIEKHSRPKKKSWKEDQRLLNAEILPHWRTRLAKEITRRDVRELLERIAADRPTSANRVHALLSKMWNFGISQDLVETNPVTHLPKPGDVAESVTTP